MEIGICSFVETAFDPAMGRQIGVEERSDTFWTRSSWPIAWGLDVFGVGEHHRPDYAVAAPSIVLAAAAARTSKIRLTSAVSVLSSDDPVRVFQDFATLDLISGGRAEIMVGGVVHGIVPPLRPGPFGLPAAAGSTPRPSCEGRSS